MKKVLMMLLAVLSLTSCDKKKDDPIKGNDENIYIYGKDRTNKGLYAGKHLTVHEILTSGDLNLHMENEYGLGVLSFFKNADISVGQYEIDTIADRLVMKAINVIENERMNRLGGALLTGRNFYLLGGDFYDEDTVAYIPNDQIREAQVKILDLWKEGKIAEIYELFNRSFYFYPCTGEEFKRIKEDIDWEHEYDSLLPEHAHTHELTW